ncbi:MAG TPA: protein-L-isoaspartate(D-aspartate) O-methyltransferase [Anaerolineae bacterium]|nr:protein-L-isoaspartate(D-aspartate) O-methyltransferase [Anaerolineae bacterium]
MKKFSGVKKTSEYDPFFEKRLRMVAEQIERRGVNDAHILEVLKKVPRHLFVPREYLDESYQDHPLPIGSGQTISQPYVVAFMTEKLNLCGEENVLEIGTGSGYQAAVLASLAKTVHTVERVKRLADNAEAVLRSLGMENVFVHHGDGSLGWSEGAPYDAVIVTAAAPNVPSPLVQQLKEGGRLVIPVGSRWRQDLELWVKNGTEIEKEAVLPVVFVPLKGKLGWRDDD